jgi:hypothetical protein
LPARPSSRSSISLMSVSGIMSSPNGSRPTLCIASFQPAALAMPFGGRRTSGQKPSPRMWGRLAQPHRIT